MSAKHSQHLPSCLFEEANKLVVIVSRSANNELRYNWNGTYELFLTFSEEYLFHAYAWEEVTFFVFFAAVI